MICLPQVTGISSHQTIDVETQISQSQIEDEEITGGSHLSDPQERHDWNKVKEEPKKTYKKNSKVKF